ncbi:MAG: filamentous hemagglutinin N-terminal domain-containing protein [Sedimentisphaerales bacterium]|nr:filamentous hemagglutinin N-terminal domain-containing protein [Sedimentisphaerales bacterium]
MLLVVIMVLQPVNVVWARPRGEKVVRGNVSFTQEGDITRIQAGNNSIINYDSFDILRHETVQFIQPSEMARVLNRIKASDPTQIDGALLANGRVYIVNPAGVMFGENSVIDVGGLYAAAGTITNEDFLAGIDHFTDVEGSVINSGTISADMVNLIGRHVANYGSILSEQGSIMLISGEDVYIGKVHENIFVRIEGAAAEGDAGDVGVDNSGTLDAGQVKLGAGDMYSMAIRTTGTVKAKDISIDGGDTGIVKVSGTVDASNAEGAGGTVEILGEKVVLTEARIDVSGAHGGGEVLVGGDYQGKGAVANASLTYVGEGSDINADATGNGDGGRVIVWADDWTGFYGAVSARGGAEGGDGGFVEVSGKSGLDFRGQVDTTAPAGQTGTLLLDPASIEVVTQASLPVPPPDPLALVDVDEFDELPGVNALLGNITLASAGTDVVLQAEGNITFNASVNMANNNVGITAQAGNNITVNQPLETTQGAIEFIADETFGGAIDGAAYDGSVMVNAPVTTNGGDFTSSGVDFQNTAVIDTTGATDGEIAISHTGTVTLSADLAGTIIGGSSTIVVDPTAQIQDGIDVAVTGASVTVQPGLYSENLTIDEQVTLTGDVATPANVGVTGLHTISSSNVTLEGLTFSDGDLTAGHVLVQVDSTGGSLDNIDILNNVFDLDNDGTPGSGDIGVGIGGQIDSMLVTDINVNNNKFNGPADMISNPVRIGGWFGTDDRTVAVDGLAFQGNTVDSGSIPIQLHDDNLANITITNNQFTNTDGTVYVWDNNGADPTGVLSGFEYSGNTVDATNTYGLGIDIYGVYDDDNFGINNVVTENLFASGIPGMDLTGIGGAGIFEAVSILSPLTTYELNAEKNWWGDAQGPSHPSNPYNSTTTGAGVSDHVDFRPWYGTPSLAENVGLFNFQNQPKIYTDTIQSAIDLAFNAAGEKVEVLVSNIYAENLNLDKSNMTLRTTPGTAVRVEGQHTIAANNVTVTSGAPGDFTFDPGPNGTAFSIAGPVRNDTLISNSMFVLNGTSPKAMAVGTVDVNGMTFQNNVVDGGSIDIELGVNSLANIDIVGNDFLNTSGAVRIWNNELLVVPGILTDLTFSGNNVGSDSYGVLFEDPGDLYGNANFNGAIALTENNFGNVTGKAIDIQSTGISDVFNAAGNWWGSTSEGAILTEISGNVDYSPWLNNDTDGNGADVGFVPDKTEITVSNTSPDFDGLGVFITEGLDFVTAGPGSIIHAKAGTYGESVNVNKQLDSLDFLGDSSISGTITLNEDLNITVNSNSGSYTLNQVSDPGAPDNLSVTEAIDINVANTVTAGGEVVLDASNTVFMADGTEINAGGRIDVEAQNNITLGRLVTSTGALNAVEVTSNNGMIVDGGDLGGVDIEANTIGARVILKAETGIGNADALETQVASLQASNDSLGDIRIIETDDIILNNVMTADGYIYVTAGGMMDAQSVQNIDGPVTLISNGTLSAQMILANDNLDNENHDISLTSNNSNIELIQVVSDNQLTALAHVDVDVDYAVSLNGDIDLTATTGSINEMTPDVDIDIQGNKLTLTAANDIGGAEAIETSINSLDASSTAAGDISLNEHNGIELLDVDTANGAITINTGVNVLGTTVITDVASNGGGDEDDIVITAHRGDITLGSVVTPAVFAAGAGDVSLEATNGSIHDTAADALVDITGDSLTLIADGEIGGTETIETAVSNLVAHSTGSGDIDIDNTTGITLEDVDTFNGEIRIVANGSTVITDVAAAGSGDEDDVTITASSGDITIGIVSAAGDGDVSLEATNGAINDATAGADGIVDITGDALIITAQKEIGSVANHLETSVNTLTAKSQGPIGPADIGDIVIDEASEINLQEVSTVDGDILITSGGAMTAAGVVAGGVGRDVTLETTSGSIEVLKVAALDDEVKLTSAGSILDGDDSATITANKAELIADGSIGLDGVGQEIDLDVQELITDTTGAAAGAGDQYIAEADGLTAILLNAGSDNDVTISVAGDIQDSDLDIDITADTAVVKAVSFGQFANRIGTDVRVLRVSTLGDQYITEDDDLAELLLDAGVAGLVDLIAAGVIEDTDGDVDVSAETLILTADAFGTLANPIQTSVDKIWIDTSGANGNQYISETDDMAISNIDAGGDAFGVGGGEVIITNANGQGIGLGLPAGANALNISGSELENIKAGSLDLNSQGRIVVGGITPTNSDTANTVTLHSGGDQVSFENAPSTFDSIVVEAAGGINVDADLATDEGDLVLVDTFTLAANLSAPGHNIILQKAGVIDGAGDQTIEAGGTLHAMESLTKITGSNLTLKGNILIDLNGTTSNNGADLIIEGTLDAEGDVTAAGNISVQDNANIVGNVTGGGNVTFGSSLVLDGGTAQTVKATSGTMKAQGTITKNSGNINLEGGHMVVLNDVVSAGGGNLNITGPLDAQKNLFASNDINVMGPANLAADVTAGNNTTFDRTVILDGAGQQTLTAGSGKLWAKGTLTKNSAGDMILAAGTIIDVDGSVDAQSGNLIVQNELFAAADLEAGQDVLLTQVTTLDGTNDQLIRSDNGNVNARMSLTKTGAGDLTLQAGNTVLLDDITDVQAGSLLVKSNVDAANNLLASIDITLEEQGTLAGNVLAGNNVTFEDMVELLNATVLDQEIMATAGVLHAQSTITKNGDGDLTLRGGSGINLDGTASVAEGSLLVQNQLTAAADLTAGENLTLLDAVVLDGANQQFSADTGMLHAHSTITKPTAGDLTLVNNGIGIELDGSVDIQSGSLLVQDNVGALADLRASANVSIHEKAFVGGNIIAGNDVLLNDDALVIGDVDAGNNILAENQLAVTGNITAGQDVTLQGLAILSGDVTGGNNVNLNNVVDLNGNGDQTVSATAGTLHAMNDLSKSGPADMILQAGVTVDLDSEVNVLQGSLVVESPLLAANNMSASENVTLNGIATLDGSGNQVISAATGVLNARDTMTKSGAGDLELVAGSQINLDAAVNVDQGSLRTKDLLVASGDLTASQDVILESQAAVTADINAGNNVAVQDVANLAGNVTGGNDVSLLGPVQLNGSSSQELKAQTGSLQVANSLTKTGTGQMVLTGDEISLAGNVSNSGRKLVLQPSNPGLDIQIGGTIVDNDTVLYLSPDELTRLQDGFSGIDIGRSNSSGAVRVGDGTGDVVFRDPLTIQSPAAGGVITVDSKLSGIDNASVTLNSVSALNADISTQGNPIILLNNVTLGSGRSVTLETVDGMPGANITVAGTVDGGDVLTVKAGTGDITLSNNTGRQTTLGSVDMSGENITVHDVITTGNQKYASASMTLESTDTVGDADGKRWVELAALDETVDLVTGLLTVGTIELDTAEVVTDGASVKMGAEFTQVPPLASVYTPYLEENGIEVPQDLTIQTNGGDFIMGMHQKITVVNGSLTIDTTGLTSNGDAALGDLTANGSIVVNTGTGPGAGDIILIAREAGELWSYDYDADNGTAKLEDADRGLDFVARDSIVFSRDDVILGGSSPRPQFASLKPGANEVPAGYVNRQLVFFPDASELVPTLGTTGLSGTLDLQASGASTANAADALAGVLEDQRPEVSVAPSIDLALLEQLVRLGINAKPDLNAPFNDLDYMCKLLEQVCEVSAGRLSADLTESSLDEYWSLFWEKTDDGMEERVSVINRVLQEALDDYMTQNEGEVFDPLGFRKYLESTGGEALAYVNRMKQLLSQIRVMGLTRYELRPVWEVLLNGIELRVEGETITMDQLEKIIEGESSYEYLLTWSGQ